MSVPTAIIIVSGEAHRRRILKSYALYYNETRTHLALEKDAPLSRTAQSSADCTTNMFGFDFRQAQGSRYSSVGSARAAPSRLVAALPGDAISNPSSAESGPVPTHERLGPHDRENPEDCWKPTIQILCRRGGGK